MHVHLHAATVGAHQPLDDDRVLVSLILHPQRVLGLVDELPDPLAGVADAPDQERLVGRRKFLALPIGIEALDDFVHLRAVPSDYGVIASFGEIFGRPS